MWGWSRWKGKVICCCLYGEMGVMCRYHWVFYSFLQFIRWISQVAVCGPVCLWVRGKRQIYPRFGIFQLTKVVAHQQSVCGLYSFFLSCCRRKKAALQAWHRSVAKKSRRRRFSSASWVPRVWASASPVVQPRNPASTSAMSSQAPSLQKLDLRLLKMTRTPFWYPEANIPACCVNCIHILSQNTGWRPDCGGERGGFHQRGPQRGSFCWIKLSVRLN